MGCSDKTCQLLPSGEITVLNKLSTCIMKIPNIPHSSHHWLGMDPGPKKLHQKSFVSLWQDLSKLSNLRNTRRMVRFFFVAWMSGENPQWFNAWKEKSFPWLSVQKFSDMKTRFRLGHFCSVDQLPLPLINLQKRVTVPLERCIDPPWHKIFPKRIKHICYIQKLCVRRCDGFGLHFHIFYENRTGKPCLFVRKASLGIITERTDAGKATPIMKVIINSRWWNCHIEFFSSIYHI